MSSGAAWLDRPVPHRRVGVKGPRAAEALEQLGLAVPARPNCWAPLRAQDRDDSWNVVGRLGFSEFFLEESGEAAGIAELEQLTARDFAGAWGRKGIRVPTWQLSQLLRPTTNPAGG